MRLIRIAGKWLLRGALIIGLLATATMLYADHEEAVMPWPNKEIKIYDNTGRPLAMKRAAKIWNSTGLNLKITLVKDPAEADVEAQGVDSFALNCKSKTVIGCASIGKASWLPWQKPTLQLKQPEPFEEDDGTKYTAVAAHEIGHLLGMQHNKKKCSLMNSESFCREIYKDINLDPECPVANGTIVLSPVDFCPGSYTNITKCGPSYDEIDELALRYGGSRDTNYRSFCQYEKRIQWRAWCLYPDWLPSGKRRPEWMEKTKQGYRCQEDAPTKYLAVISYAVSEINSELNSLNQPMVTGASSAFMRSGVYRKLREDRIRRLRILKERYSSLMPPRLRVVL